MPELDLEGEVEQGLREDLTCPCHLSPGVSLSLARHSGQAAQQAWYVGSQHPAGLHLQNKGRPGGKRQVWVPAAVPIQSRCQAPQLGRPCWPPPGISCLQRRLVCLTPGAPIDREEQKQDISPQSLAAQAGLARVPLRHLSCPFIWDRETPRESSPGEWSALQGTWGDGGDSERGPCGWPC